MTKKVFGTKEWADISSNCSDGCENDCKYCYAKEIAIRFGRRTPENWKEVRPTFKKMSKALRHAPAKVMFPTTHDILPSNLEECVRAIRKILDAGHDLLIVSKPRIECIKRLCHEFKSYRDRILFRFTIGSACNTVLNHWEPGAPNFEERIECLKLAHDSNFETSVSCEPMLDDNIGAVVIAAEPFVTDSIWLGKMNHASARLTMNGGTTDDLDILRILMSTQTDEKIMALYETYKDHPKIKWKESIKSVVGIEIPTEPGLDI